MRKNHNVILKYLLLISVLMLMMLLCACRTRLTNNTEVAATITDEDGWLAESYEMRREDLGSPVAERPIFTGFGSDDEDDDFYDDSDALEDYDPNADVWDEPDEPDDSTVSTNPGTSTTTTPSSPTYRQTPSTPANTDMITITLELNDGQGTRYTRSFKKGTSYKEIPDGSWAGHKFIEWTTDKENKKPVKRNDKMTVSQTLYAHWEDAPEKKKTYTVSFDVNNDEVDPISETIKVEEGGTYTGLPAVDRKDFKGWFTKKSGGSKISEGSTFTGKKNHTLYAQWKNASELWEDAFKEDANKVSKEDELPCFVEDGSSAENSLIKECRGNLVKDDEDPVCRICFMKNYTEDGAEALAREIYERNKTEDSGPDRVIVISDEALTGSDDQKTLYKLLILDALYAAVGEEDIEKAIEQLNVSGIYPYIYPPIEQ